MQLSPSLEDLASPVSYRECMIDIEKWEEVEAVTLDTLAAETRQVGMPKWVNLPGEEAHQKGNGVTQEVRLCQTG